MLHKVENRIPYVFLLTNINLVIEIVFKTLNIIPALSNFQE